jgi:hypothetical protein
MWLVLGAGLAMVAITDGVYLYRDDQSEQHQVGRG